MLESNGRRRHRGDLGSRPAVAQVAARSQWRLRRVGAQRSVQIPSRFVAPSAGTEHIIRPGRPTLRQGWAGRRDTRAQREQERCANFAVNLVHPALSRTSLKRPYREPRRNPRSRRSFPAGMPIPVLGEGLAAVACRRFSKRMAGLGRRGHDDPVVVTTPLPVQRSPFGKARDNDLASPLSGLWVPRSQAGDSWCLCAARWQEALDADAAPRVIPGRHLRRSLKIAELPDAGPVRFQQDVRQLYVACGITLTPGRSLL